MLLRDRWQIESSAKVREDGERISAPDYDAGDWEPTHVPTTVMGALHRNGRYPDLFVGKNLEKVDRSRFEVPWWFRTEFEVGDESALTHSRLELDGVNYRAGIWLNGRRIASDQEVAGPFRRFSFDVSSVLRCGLNALAAKVTGPEPTDYTIGFVDWNPMPPDRNLGLWRQVRLRRTGPITLSEPFVATDVDLETLDSASLTIAVDVQNNTSEAVAGWLRARVADAEVELPVSLGPQETKRLRLDAEQFPELRLSEPHLWWPHDLGEPHLYSLDVEFESEGRVSDRRSVRFGVRSVSDYFTEEGHRGFRVNGEPVLIRGGGWTDDIFLDDDADRIRAQVDYVRHMNLNTIRVEGFWGNSPLLYDLCDQRGILVLAGWSCQWEWEHNLGKPSDEFGCIHAPEDQDLIAESWRDQVCWLRNHPSIIAWYPGSDKLPPPELERRYLQTLNKCDPTRIYVGSAAKRDSEVSGPSGMKMLGPYAYVPPVYWHEDTHRGGAYGFNTETGPGAQPSPFSSLVRMMPEDDLWPPDEMWDYHCARGKFGAIERYYDALSNRYGRPEGPEEFCRMAQIASYEAMRGMFEAFRARRPAATGVVQWMLNSAWPKLYWQLYDYYLMPNGAFYGARKACQPLQLIYDYANRQVYVANSTRSAYEGLEATIQVTDAVGSEVARRRVPLSVAPNRSEAVAELPASGSEDALRFLRLILAGAGGTRIAENVYWLPRRRDVMDHENGNWFVTPIKEYADLTALKALPDADLNVRCDWQEQRTGTSVRVSLANRAEVVAFGVELTAVSPETGEPILPVLWDDNYMAVFPGETVAIAGRLPTWCGPRPELKVSGWNVRRRC